MKRIQRLVGFLAWGLLLNHRCGSLMFWKFKICVHTSFAWKQNKFLWMPQLFCSVSHRDFNSLMVCRCRSQWPRGLRRVVASTARTLGSRVRILFGAWMRVRVFLCCVFLSRYRPCVGLIPRPRSPTKCPNRFISSEVLNRNRPWMAYTLKDDASDDL
jgi:hypothetical protein